MTLDVLLAEMLALGLVEVMAPSERSAESLALMLAPCRGACPHRPRDKHR